MSTKQNPKTKQLKPSAIAGEVSNICLDKDGDLLFLTVGMYKLFLSQQGGHDAFQLYMHLMFTARLQETNQVWARDTYLMKGLGIGTPRLKKAKALLKKLGLIEYVRNRKEDGTLDKVYIKMNFVTREPTTGIIIHPVDSHTTGASRQMLKVNKLNALNEEEKALSHTDIKSKEGEEQCPICGHIGFDRNICAHCHTPRLYEPTDEDVSDILAIAVAAGVVV